MLSECGCLGVISTQVRFNSQHQPLDLNELAATCDIISIHVSGIPENHHLLSQTMIRSLKPGAWVVNTSRGSVVDEAALAEAVVSGHIAGVAVDVLDGEERGETGLNPLFLCALAGHNVLITPHLGGATCELISHAEKAVVDVLITTSRSLQTLNARPFPISSTDVCKPQTPNSSQSMSELPDDTAIVSNQCRTRIDSECARYDLPEEQDVSEVSILYLATFSSSEVECGSISSVMRRFRKRRPRHCVGLQVAQQIYSGCGSESRRGPPRLITSSFFRRRNANPTSFL